ncbi:hypothetical protein [Arthrobacter globiformis]|uniref:hypothetical protein n=1 Tax=Arthrobacter globiformis TaxID=1665 RepID=UPI0027D8E677|nr:hypothetical protein [Arthrobacter globiformis]
MGVIPPFSEQFQHICHNRATQLECGIVPRWSFPVPGIHGHRLRVAPVIGIVPAAVRKVDSAHEGDVPRRVVTPADDHQFLVMAAEEAYTLIQQNLAAGIVDLTAEELVGPPTHRGRHALSVGSPNQAAHFHSRFG